MARSLWPGARHGLTVLSASCGKDTQGKCVLAGCAEAHTIYRGDWRSKMFNSRGHRRLWLAAAAAGFLTLAGCSDQATEQATNRKPAAAAAKKNGGSKAAPANHTAKKVQTGKLVTVPKGTSISATMGQADRKSVV